MKCIILDDEPHAIDILRRYIEKSPGLVLVETFRNPLKALEYLQQASVDLLFLDVNMPNLSGIQFLKALKKKPLIIFTTAYSTYAAESYEWDAIDYLVKPIVFERFLKAVGKAKDTQNQQTAAPSELPVKEDDTDVISVKSGNQIHRISLGDIRFITKQSNYLEINTSDRKILMRANMADIFSWLPEEKFCRIHKSSVVALKHVNVIEAHQVKVGDIKLSVGPGYRKDFMKKFEK